MLRLLSLLQTHRYWPGPELSDRLEVSPRTLRRDVDRLRELGYTVDAVRGAAGGYQLRAGGSLPPLLLEDEEAVAIAVGLRTAAAGAVAGTDDWSVQALSKVLSLMPPRLRRQMDARRVADRVARAVGGRARRRRDGADHAGPGLPRQRAAALRLRRARGRGDPPPRRAAAPGLPRPPVVPRRPGTATGRTGAASASTGSPTPSPPASAFRAARAARRGRPRVRAAGHPPDAPALRRTRPGGDRRPRTLAAQVGRWGTVTRGRRRAACSR